MLYGYARVSTKDQETTLQLDALCNAGVLEVRQEKGSSVGPRPELQRLLLIRQALFVNLARAEVSKPLDGLKLNDIGTLQ